MSCSAVSSASRRFVIWAAWAASVVSISSVLTGSCSSYFADSSSILECTLHLIATSVCLPLQIRRGLDPLFSDFWVFGLLLDNSRVVLSTNDRPLCFTGFRSIPSVLPSSSVATGTFRIPAGRSVNCEGYITYLCYYWKFIAQIWSWLGITANVTHAF